MASPLATILITSKNRKEELERAIASAVMQNVPVEVYVIDDGSTDGTAEMVRQKFPQIRFERSEQSQGYVLHRTRGAIAASAPIVFSIDDDAAFTSPSAVEQTLKDFDHPRVGAVAIPYCDVVLTGDKVFQKAPSASGVFVIHEYRGCAHALRKDIFAKLGGYRNALWFAGEEQDYCIRMLAAGYVTRMGNADVIHHYESPKRDKSKQVTYFTRNNMCLTWANVPWPDFGVRMIKGPVGQVVAHTRNGYFKATMRGLWAGVSTIASGAFKREPVPANVFRAQRWLERNAPVTLEQLDAKLGRVPRPVLVAEGA